MRTYDTTKGPEASKSALREMKARLALLDSAIAALQSYQDQADEDRCEIVADARLRPIPFLVARRDDARTEKAS